MPPLPVTAIMLACLIASAHEFRMMIREMRQESERLARECFNPYCTVPGHRKNV